MGLVYPSASAAAASAAAARTAGITSQSGSAPFSIAAFATSSVHIQCTFKAGWPIDWSPAGGTASDGLPNTPHMSLHQLRLELRQVRLLSH